MSITLDASGNISIIKGYNIIVLTPKDIEKIIELQWEKDSAERNNRIKSVQE